MPGDLEVLLAALLLPRGNRQGQSIVSNLFFDEMTYPFTDEGLTNYTPTSTWNGANTKWGECLWG